jgi:outer membrane cobalamin receptor
MSPFLQIDAQVADPLRLSLGARYDDYSTGESSITPRMGAIWESGSQTTFKLLYGESFRVPNLEERHPGEAGSEKNPALGPESNESWEFSVERVLSSIWTFDIKGYEVRSEGLITTANLPSGNYTYVNQDSYRTIGLEFGGLAHFSGNRTIRASLTRQRTEDDATQREVADAPEILAKLNLTTPLYQDWLRCSVELQYVGKRSDFSSPAEPVEDFFTGNLTLRAAPLWHRWDLAITVYNVADSHWTEPKNSGQIATRPRSAVLRITRDF